ncbi:16S rRNA (guanine(966)-N(2))-methyltransferase RsmD [Alteromonas sediminis]|uniref:Ribosomal RNA small subunit methyltransferase D n=1 Tax=Alteromonas sediminis TaxID=2259342 RepID=A0A3N5Y450_9ALTE|nr:16S rRNA (guanine(966)-N(2))-methyltransferase RsmD [Alteromonas sediminis]RPJ64829.1 16S rRNA (guanine(966)-N(2))-methyltransferase RsmD [Alteromonas sediminis]
MITLSRPRNRASGQVRIIGGQWRGRKLPVLDSEGLRPTTDRTRETLFNWLMNDIRGTQCLDAFAGSASLGFEALSRGAASLTFIEFDKNTAKQIKHNCQTLAISSKVLQGDALSLLSNFNEQFDVIFADPPFGKGLLIPFVEKVLSERKLAQGGWLYIEHESSLSVPDWPELIKHREKTAGQFTYALYYLTSQ